VIADNCSASGWLREICQYPGLGPIFGNTFAAAITSVVVISVAKRYTKSLKRTEATLEFSKRFQELIRDQLDLNKKYAATTRVVGPQDANVWWWRFFDLMLYEFNFFQEDLVSKERFIEWMKWRRYDYNCNASEIWETCGITYPAAWQTWRSRSPLAGNAFIGFLDEIHSERNTVETIVERAAPRWWRNGRWRGTRTERTRRKVRWFFKSKSKIVK
jgi:hypothetical protein